MRTDTWRRGALLAACMTITGLSTAGARAAEPPPFLPGYYARFFNNLQIVDHGEQNGLETYRYSSTDGGETTTVASFNCDSARCGVIQNNPVGRHSDTPLKSETQSRCY